MKRKLFTIGSVLFLLIASFYSYYYFNTIKYTPLKEKELKQLFLSYKVVTQECYVDYVGLSFHNELFEVYLFSTKEVLLGIDYPVYTKKWEKEAITDEVISSKWKNCPLDVTSYDLFKSEFIAINFNKEKCLNSFYEELNNPDNFYSYLYFNDLEYYFLLYSPLKEKLYYIRFRL